MDEELKKRLADYFEPWELVDFLDIPVEQVISAFEDEIFNKIVEVMEFINHGE